MIVGQGGKTGQGQKEQPGVMNWVFHLSCRQANALLIRNDDIQYQHLVVSKVILFGRVTRIEKGNSPRGMPTIQARWTDSTGSCRVDFYDRVGLEATLQSNCYLKASVTAKCGGLAYRPQLGLNGGSVTVVEDLNELTEHWLECMKTETRALS